LESNARGAVKVVEETQTGMTVTQGKRTNKMGFFIGGRKKKVNGAGE